jgi:hypothetical protein
MTVAFDVKRLLLAWSQYPKGIAPWGANRDGLAADLLDQPSVQCPFGVLHPADFAVFVLA